MKVEGFFLGGVKSWADVIAYVLKLSLQVFSKNYYFYCCFDIQKEVVVFLFIASDCINKSSNAGQRAIGLHQEECFRHAYAKLLKAAVYFVI